MDNFTPDILDPTTGDVVPGNGNLIGIGSAPGAANATESLVFDQRDRLTSYSGPNGDETYNYHANGPLSSSMLGADELRFFYDKSSNAQVVNVYQGATDLWSARLGRVRYLDSGSEEVLLVPRKDVAGSYKPSDDSLQSYLYSAYGESPL